MFRVKLPFLNQRSLDTQMMQSLASKMVSATSGDVPNPLYKESPVAFGNRFKRIVEAKGYWHYH